MSKNKSRVAIASDTDRYKTVRLALELIEEDIATKIRDKKRIVIKPNFVNVLRSLACTQVGTVEAILDVVTKYTDRQITIAEGSATSTWAGFARFGYLPLKRKHDVKFINLNRDRSRHVDIFNSDLHKLSVPVADTILSSDFLISAAVMKTHDTVLVTLGLKNVLVGAIKGTSQKGRIHQGYKAINLTLAKLAEIYHPHLSVVDGWRAMEGNGPSGGTTVNMKIAVASMDFLAADIVVTDLMNFKLEEIGYLWHLRNTGIGAGNLQNIEILGESLDDHRHSFKRHRSWRSQLNWK